ncbi:universal stress protein [Zeaxanthinibacter enoshimensis]|uniref:Nucleotide-binding universal stress UspA family protein n=1 Tax=Zeaxanthinibacter enoshimensis TaxID=392009 RepID=A0A4R6TNH9_9FLAO|nr:universal stress protein [Zeaxanthinibacter enoshimensis]TDQ30891.1 nucleotide-binding universal stress UspA family protein [Zeaxanthinibacter enoshimensis]
MRKVIIPSDFSENAFNALKYACQVFKYEKSEFYLVHAYADEVYQDYSGTDRDAFEKRKLEIEKAAATRLQKVEEQMHSYAPNPRHKVYRQTEFGTLTDVINDLVISMNADAVVMGTQGQTNDRKITFGSNTVQVFKYVHCPVIAVPANYSYTQPKQILFPTDYMIPYKRRELKLLCNMIASFRSTVHVLYIDSVSKLSMRQEDNREFLRCGLGNPNLFFENSNLKDKTQAILKAIEEHEIQMLVMVNSRNSHLEDMLYPSTVDILALKLEIPFMVLQNLSR